MFIQSVETLEMCMDKLKRDNEHRTSETAMI